MRLKAVIFLLVLLLFIPALSIKAVTATSLNGKILLQVESHGEAWYVSPRDGNRHYMKNGEAALKLMREVGVGISNDNLKKIPVANANLKGDKDTDSDGLSDVVEEALGTNRDRADSDNDGHDDYTEIINGYNPLGSGKLNYDLNFAKAQAGKIFLQVDGKGEAWYVNPDNNKRYFLSRPSDAYNLMRSLGLGISNKDLEKIKTNSDNSVNKESSVGGVTTSSSAWSCGDIVTFIYNGAPVTYGTVFNSATNNCWLDRNLGATRVALSSTDFDAYGDLFQWGRLADGHQIRTSKATNTKSKTNVPGHGNFIASNSDLYDWLSPQNNNLWQGVNGINNPCPTGFRIPTDTELEEEMESWISNNAAGAFSSPLKLTLASGRSDGDNFTQDFGSFGFYWSSSVEGASSRGLFLTSDAAGLGSDGRQYGLTVRCTKD